MAAADAILLIVHCSRDIVAGLTGRLYATTLGGRWFALSLLQLA